MPPASTLHPDGAQSWDLVFECADGAGTCSPKPLDLGGETDGLYLLLFGTGIRGHRALEDVQVRIGGVEAEVLYAGPQGTFVGLDQVNVRVPQALAGSGEVEISLSVSGKAANPVTVAFR